MQGANPANRDQAGEAIRRGYSLYKQGEFSRAARMFQKSHSLYPSDEAAAGLTKCQHAMSSGSSGASSSGSSSSGGARQRQPPEPEDPHLIVIQTVRRAKDYYEVLQLTRSADEKQIKKSYRKLVLKLHPDKNSHPGAKEMFTKVSDAFTTLSEPQQRRKYDALGHEQFVAEKQGGGGGAGMSPFGGGARGGRMYRGQEVTPEDLFNMFFAGRGFQGTQSRFSRMRVPPPRRPTMNRAQREAEARARAVYQLGPMVLIVLFLLLSWATSSTPVYEIQRSRAFPNKQQFMAGGETLSYHTSATWDGKNRKQIEGEVLQQYASFYQDQCRVDDRKRRYQMWGASREDQEKLKEQVPESCAMYHRIVNFKTKAAR